MGYFPNGTSGLDYESRYCEHCVHNGMDENGEFPDGGCPILLLHLMWNYDQCDDDDKKLALDVFIPRSEDGLSNEQCKMFLNKETSNT